MSLSAFEDPARAPTAEGLREALGPAHGAWTRLVGRISKELEPITEDWSHLGARAGWVLRLRRGGRVLLYLTPMRGAVRVSFALGEKAVKAARSERLPARVLEVLESAPRYAEGRGVRFEIRTVREVAPLVTLARVKHES